MVDVFLSYSREDRDVASMLARALADQGVSVWFDTAITAGEDFAAKILEELKRAVAVIAVWSPKSVESQWLRGEAEYARTAGKLIQVSIGNAQLGPPYNAMQTISLDGWNGNTEDSRFRQILASLRARGVNKIREPVVQDRAGNGDVDKIFEARPEDARLDSLYTDFFVAYSRHDTARCEDFILQLRHQELDVFYDQFIRSGEAWLQSIAGNIIGLLCFRSYAERPLNCIARG
jgi:hypothetical protein